MERQIILHLCFQLFLACDVPVGSNEALVADECERSHRMGDLSITLPCDWKLDDPKNNMFWLRNGPNTMLLQHGDVVPPAGRYEADSSLTVIFSERRVSGRIERNKNERFIHAIRPLSSGRGDSLFIYMEDTTTWKYYHFDGHFVNAELREGFMNAMRASELIR